MKKKNQVYTPENAIRPTFSLTDQKREKTIEKLEDRRLDVQKEIEALLRDYAKESGNAPVADRKYKVGKAPNDYGYRKK